MKSLDLLFVYDPSIHSRIVVDEWTGCWLYGGSPTGSGHCQIKRGGRRWMVHRRVWQLLMDPTFGEKDDIVLDHICRVQNCCNPEHLRPVTHRQNTLLGINGVLGQQRSGLIGVTYNRFQRRYMVRTTNKGIRVHIGSSLVSEEAGVLYDASCFAFGVFPANHSAGRVSILPTEQQVRDTHHRLRSFGCETIEIDEALALLDTFRQSAAA